MSRCVMETKAGKQCRWPGSIMVGGLSVCEHHVNAAARLWNDVKDKLPQTVRDSAKRDTRQRNA